MNSSSAITCNDNRNESSVLIFLEAVSREEMTSLTSGKSQFCCFRALGR